MKIYTKSNKNIKICFFLIKRALFYQPQFRQYKKEIGTQPTPIPLCYILVVYKLNTTFKIISSTIYNLMYKDIQN